MNQTVSKGAHNSSVPKGGYREAGQQYKGGFTPREWHILAMQAQNVPDAVIAKELGLTLASVKQYAYEVRQKALKFFGHVTYGRRNGRYILLRILEGISS